MIKKWVSGLVFGLCFQTTIFAQSPLAPPPDAAAPLTEPLPYSTGIQTPMYQERAQNFAAPPSCPTPSPLALPSNLPNAWDKAPPPGANYHDCPGAYFNIGALALERQGLGHGPVAVMDSGFGKTNISPFFPPFGSIIPQPREILDFNQLSPSYGTGVKGAIGYHCDCQAIELTGFYLRHNERDLALAHQGGIDEFFSNFPAGFAGDNGLGLQADYVKIGFQTQLGDAEVNYRREADWIPGFEWLVGVRYLDLQERLRIYTDEDGLTFRDVNGFTDPTRQFTYSVQTHNRIVAPQLGFEMERKLLSCITFGVSGKGAWGVNYIDNKIALSRNDGLAGFNGSRSATVFSHMYQTGVYLDFCLFERARLRAGYNAMWVLGVAEAVDQVDYDLSNTSGRTNNQGSVFYHGPSLEMQFLF